MRVANLRSRLLPAPGVVMSSLGVGDYGKITLWRATALSELPVLPTGKRGVTASAPMAFAREGALALFEHLQKIGGAPLHVEALWAPAGDAGTESSCRGSKATSSAAHSSASHASNGARMTLAW